MSLRSESIVRTQAPARNMARLCNHLAHRVTVVRNPTDARVDFPGGAVALMEAGDETLRMHIDAPDEAALTRIKDVLGRHLAQVAAGETLEIVWSETESTG
jgi:hypothetical protein